MTKIFSIYAVHPKIIRDKIYNFSIIFSQISFYLENRS